MWTASSTILLQAALALLPLVVALYVAVAVVLLVRWWRARSAFIPRIGK